MKDKKGPVELVKDRWGSRMHFMNRELAQWTINRRGYAGDYWLNAIAPKTVGSSYTFTRVKTRYGFTENHAKNVANSLLASLTQDRPNITITPRTSDPRDMDRASFSQDFLDALWQYLEIQTVLQRGLMPVILTGTGFLKVFWDKNAGEEGLVPGKKEGTPAEYGKLGEIALIPREPENMIFDRYASSIETATWCLDVYEKHIDQIRWQYKGMAEKIKPDAGSGEFYLSRGIMGMPSGPGNLDEGVIVKEMYVKPCLEYKNGLYCKVVGDTILEESEIGADDWPFIKFTYYLPSYDSSMWGETPMTDVISIVRQLNFTMTQMLDNLALFGNHQWFKKKNSKIDSKTIDNKPGRVYEGNDIEELQKIDASNLPQSFFSLHDVLVGAIEDLSAVNKSMKGQNPPGVRSSAMLTFLAEQGFRHLIPTAARLKESYGKLAMRCLKLAYDHYDEGRLISFTGKNNTHEAIEFKREMITWKNIRVEVSAYLAQSKAQVHELAYELWDRGIVKDPGRVLSMIELGSVRGWRDVGEVARDQAKRENEGIMNGVYPEYADWQIHPAHIEEHLLFMSSPAYEAMKRKAMEWEIPLPAEMPQQAQAPAQMGGLPMGGLPQMGMPQAAPEQPGMTTPMDIPGMFGEMPFPGSGMGGGMEEPATAPQSATMRQSIGFVAAEHLKKHLDREALEAQQAAALQQNIPPEEGGQPGPEAPIAEEPINGAI